MQKICYVLTIPLTVRAFFIPQLKKLSQNGFDVTVICSPDEKLQSELGDDIKYIPLELPRGIALSSSLRAVRSLRRIFKQERFDMVQYSTPNAALYASMAARCAGVKVRNYHLMGFRFLGAKGVGRFVLKTLEKLGCTLSTHIECVSQSNLELGVKEKIFARKKATVIGSGSTGGIDLARFDVSKREVYRKEIRDRLGLLENDFVYGFVGRITRDKGINEILEAYLSLETKDKLMIIGDKEENAALSAELLKKAEENANVIFHPSTSGIEKFYCAFDVLLFPSYREGFGNVVIEAAAMGTPAIISDIAGPIDAVIGGETALVVEARNTASLRDALIKIKQLDTQKMGVAASRFATENFDSDKLNEKILERKRSLLQCNKR